MNTSNNIMSQFELEANPSYSCPSKVTTLSNTVTPETEAHVYETVDKTD